MSQFTLTFTTDLAIGAKIVVRTGDLNDVIFGALQETWVNFRSQSYQVSVGTPVVGSPGERAAINFVTAFNLDYNGIGLYTITRFQNEVTISSTITNLKFFPPTTPSPLLPNGPYPALPAGVFLNIANSSASVFNVTDVSFLTAVDNPPCTHYRVAVTTSQLTTEIQLPVQVLGNTANPFYFEIPRNVGFILSCKAADGQIATGGFTYFQIPQTINPAALSVNVVNSPNGSTVTAYYLHTISAPNIYEFSLDGVDWQTSNVFSGLPNGDYSVYVRDQYGCSTFLDVNINVDNIVIPHFYICKSNSIRFAERIAYGNCGPYKKDEDTLSCEAFAEDPDLAYKEVQQFQTCDSPTTQFETNYAVQSVKVIKENGEENVISVNQMTNNIGIKDSRDAIKINLGYGRTGIYFISGNLYDYDTGIDSGEDYLLNGGLPEWGRIGKFLSISNTWFEIIDILYDENLEVEMLVINSIYNGAPANVIVKSQYNRQDYEVYEFINPFSAYNNQNIQVYFSIEDDRFQNREFISETINIKERHPDTVEIKYYNEGNTDVYYQTGIKHLIRLPIRSIKGDHQDDSELLITDNGSSLQKSEVYEIDIFEFLPVSKGIYRKAVQAFSHKYLEMDGVPYAKNGNIEKEGPLEESNLYIIRAKLIKTNAPFSLNITSNNQQLILPNENLEVPNIVITDHGEFISYQ